MSAPSASAQNNVSLFLAIGYVQRQKQNVRMDADKKVKREFLKNLQL